MTVSKAGSSFLPANGLRLRLLGCAAGMVMAGMVMTPGIAGSDEVTAATAATDDDESALYLGQEPPGKKPELFAPGVVSKPDQHEFGAVFSADGKQLFFGVDLGERAEIRYMEWDGERWSEPSVLVHHPVYGFNDPFLSPDETELYFISDRPLSGDGAAKDIDIWFIRRTTDGWSQPEVLPAPIRSAKNEYYISFNSQGDLYFASNIAAEADRQFDFDMYVSRRVDGQFTKPLRLPDTVNSRAYEADVLVAWDESYLIFSAIRRGGLGRGDLYISFKTEAGGWSQARNLGPNINTEGHELCPFVSRDGKYLFFTSNQDIYWVDASVLEDARLSTND